MSKKRTQRVSLIAHRIFPWKSHPPRWNRRLSESWFFTDPEGRLWVQRFRPAGGDPTGPRTWEIYDSQGAYLGALDLALASNPTPAVRNDRLVGAVTDHLEVPYIVVFELLTGGS